MQAVTNFPGTSRFHLALGVRDLERSTTFYHHLLGVIPDKQRPGYVRFTSRDPSLNLSLHQEAEPRGGAQHYGIQVKSATAVAQASQRLQQVGVHVESEMAVTCCYAGQDKVWTRDPDGNYWEIFFTYADTTELASAHRNAHISCCEPHQTTSACG